MQIIIEIPEEMYQKIKETNMVISGRRNGKRIDYILFNAVDVGISLPKGHGRIADIDKVLEEMRATRTYDIPFALERVKPIVEADGCIADAV